MRIFITSPWVPPEWIKAHGLEPQGIWTAPALPELTPAAGVCAHAETVLRHAEGTANAAFIFSSHCDQLRRSFDALTAPALQRAFLFNLPATCGTPGASVLFREELKRLSAWLKKLGGKEPELDTLQQLTKDSQLARGRLIEASGRYTAREYAQMILRFQENGSLEPPASETPLRDSPGIRLAVIGGPFIPRFWPLLDEVERAGGKVVLNATEAGERSLGLCDAFHGEGFRANPTLESLSELFLNRMVDVFQRPNDRLFQWLKQRIIERRVEALVLWHYFGCDLWRAELQTLQETLGLPVLMLEADETDGGFARIQTRLQAFLERLSSS